MVHESSSRIERSDGVIRLRRPGTAAFVGVLALGMMALGVAAMVSPPGENSLVDRLISASLCVALAWVIWRTGGYPRLEITPSHLIVRNPVFTHEIPWRAIDDVEAVDGLTIVMPDYYYVRALAFGGSIFLDIFGDRTLRRAQRLIAAARDRPLAGPDMPPPEPRRLLHVQWWLLPVVLILVVVVAWGTWKLDTPALWRPR
ncbi:PH domain-containing protein [Actinopolymorpha cephalotaxi]|uniref:Low molecular weight protein antigen 6 PH domain-containing protein n=1 Tax=Actinopolymorpha cephalotaxi TaxID=504797 RepID=A0ABX2S8W9_9ACTN|nr:PH domain-containing protein [Actinopolymorpha cephalotaxi]NYH85729.1 hypothetical protein [Actinopolymorpha cephalotaxi]